MRRLITLLLLATFLLPALLHAQYTYTTNGSGLTITRFMGGGAVIIPSTANGLPVTSIGEDSFNDSFSLTSVVIPNSVTNIGDEAFSDCYSMTSVTLGTNVLSIANYAFQYCSKLPNLTIPASVTNIGLDVFSGCTAFTNITVTSPNPAYGSQNGVLFNQNATTLVIYPQGLAGPYVVPDTVTDFAEDAFYACSKLTSITSDTNLVTIEPAAFSGCYNLTNINLPTNVANIRDAAFAFCTNLTSVALPASVTNIEIGAFAECLSLTNISVAPENPAFTGMGGVVFDKKMTTLDVYPAGLDGSYVIPDTVTSIGYAAFAYCGRLWNVTFPAGLTNIGIQAFYECGLMTNAPLPPTLTTIGTYAFWECYKLQGLTIPDSVTTLGEEVFGACTSITNVVIGNNITNISDSMFAYCSGLRTATLGNSMTNIGYSQFQNCSSLTKVTIGTGVTNIGYLAFANCSSLTNLTFLGNAPGIPGSQAFNNIDPAVKVYYQPGTTGWGTSYGGAFDAPVNVAAGILPTTTLVNGPPPISESNPGIVTNEFAFTITGASNETVIVQASTNLLDWATVKTNTLPGAPLIFSDPNWRNYPQRFYRLIGQ
ncbi:MAG TPA: leucine-rich repeat domain-containing protein [Verrucomicrobiae bacterium]|jgi:hypothetical protein